MQPRERERKSKREVTDYSHLRLGASAVMLTNDVCAGTLDENYYVPWEYNDAQFLGQHNSHLKSSLN